jgi:iron complex transport system substrate-binding protein
VIIQWWPKPTIAPGKLSWAHDVLEIAGGHNPIGREAVKSRPISDEEIAELAPDAIVLSWCGVHPDKYRPDVVLEKAAWADVPAVRNGHVFCVPEAYLGRPGPRLVDGVRALRAVVEAVRPGNAASAPA